MNGKKARKLRKLLLERGLDVMGEPKLMMKEHKRLIHVVDPTTGNLTAKAVVKQEIQNHTKLPYRRAKKLFKSGELAL